MRFCIILFALMFHGTISSAQNLDCKPKPRAASVEPEQCPTAPLGVGAWTMIPVTNVTATAVKNGVRAYDSKPIGRSSIAATFDPLDCTGTARIDIHESGRSFELRQVFSEDEGEGVDHANLVGTTVIQPALNLVGKVEVRASSRDSAMLSLTVDGARFADVVKGGVVLKMEYADKRDIHPYCDCRKNLREYIDDQIKFYQDILAGYENTNLWVRPKDLNEYIPYDYVNYNQYMLMVTQRGMTPEAVTECFNVQYARMTAEDKAIRTLVSYFAREGRAGAATDNKTCEMSNVGDDDSCYSAIVDEMEFVHETVHHNECLAVEKNRNRIEKRKEFQWMRDVDPNSFEVPIGDPTNTEPQALAETEVRAYRATIAFLESWEEDNCEPK